MKKPFIVVLLIITILIAGIFSLAACGGKNDEKNTPAQTVPVDNGFDGELDGY